MFEELWSKIRDFVRSIMNNSDNYNEKYANISKKTLELYNIIIVARSISRENHKYYLQVF